MVRSDAQGNPPFKTRLAPSPTGLLHFGNVRTALFNVLAARKHAGTFLLRIEDTDLERSRDEYVQAIYRDLGWLGLDWQEGGDLPGPAAPYRQSRRTPIYEEFLERLSGLARVYPCFCTATELEISRKLQAQAGQPPRYSGKCAHLKPDEAAAKIAQGLPFTQRFRMPKSGLMEFDDLVRGPQKFASDEIGDFIIRRSDGSFAFFYVNALDDALMGVTHVLRGEDHLTNTPRQIALLEALGFPMPRYGHISLIVDGKGAPLSKRSGSLSVDELRCIGYFPLAVNNYLARLGHHYDDNRLLALDQLAANFDWSHLGRAPARYDRTQLDHWQALAVHGASIEELMAWLSDGVAGLVPQAELAGFAEAVRDNVVFPADARVWAEAIYAERPPLSGEARTVLDQADPGFFRAAAQELSEEMDFKAFSLRVKGATGVSGKALFQPLRAALTGQVLGPEMPRIFPLIGYRRARQRLAGLQLTTQID